MATSKSLERTLFSIAMFVTCALLTGALLIVAIVDVVTTRRELSDAAAAASPRIETSVRSGDVQHALDGMTAIAAARLYARDGRLLAETPRRALRPGLSTRLAAMLAATEIVCTPGADGSTFCAEVSAAALAIRISWWLRILATGFAAGLLLGAGVGWLLRRALFRRVQPIVEVVERMTRGRDYSQRVPAQPRGLVGTLGQSLNALAERMHQQEAAFRRHTVELEAMNKELEGFAYAVSHDLRAPLSSVDGFAQALNDEYAGRLDDEGREYLSWILEGCRQMRELIEGMLEMARLTRAELSHDDVDLSSIARSVADQLQQQAPERQVRFEIRDGARVIGDARLLRSVLENLMNNAFKFTRGRNDARIEFGVLPNGSDPAFFVRDNGAGFDSSQAAKMFRPFQRLHSSREFEGTGIGLATVQKIVMRHGGKAWAEGEVGKGATVYFTTGHTRDELPREIRT
ncbi:MAG TPA: ATP-binding protein [Thermoanaerobaculia bacterium]|nr:ATP-binding protein [Thermoanaerobaculia bacterium]